MEWNKIENFTCLRYVAMTPISLALIFGGLFSFCCSLSKFSTRSTSWVASIGLKKLGASPSLIWKYKKSFQSWLIVQDCLECVVFSEDWENRLCKTNFEWEICSQKILGRRLGVGLWLESSPLWDKESKNLSFKSLEIIFSYIWLVLRHRGNTSIVLQRHSERVVV